MSLTVKNIEKFYGNKQILKGISFDIPQGSIVGFLGPNGAGKSTMMKIITGYITDYNGTANVCGIDVRQNPIEAKKLIGYLPENNPLYLDMYVKEYLLFVAKMYQLEDAENAVKRMIECVGLQNDFQKKIGQLSKGYKQRVGLAQAMIHDPQVLILDEPTTGLDPNQLVEIRQLIKNLGKEKTVLFSTHIMQEVNAVCDRVMVINKGTLVNDNVQFSNDSFTFVLELEQLPKDTECFKEISGVTNVRKIADNEIEIEASEDVRSDIYKFSMQKELIIKTLKQKELSMEDLFHQLTKS